MCSPLPTSLFETLAQRELRGQACCAKGRHGLRDWAARDPCRLPSRRVEAKLQQSHSEFTQRAHFRCESATNMGTPTTIFLEETRMALCMHFACGCGCLVKCLSCDHSNHWLCVSLSSRRSSNDHRQESPLHLLWSIAQLQGALFPVGMFIGIAVTTARASNAKRNHFSIDAVSISHHSRCPALAPSSCCRSSSPKNFLSLTLFPPTGAELDGVSG